MLLQVDAEKLLAQMKEGRIFFGWAYNKARKLVRKSILGIVD